MRRWIDPSKFLFIQLKPIAQNIISHSIFTYIKRYSAKIQEEHGTVVDTTISSSRLRAIADAARRRHQLSGLSGPSGPPGPPVTAGGTIQVYAGQTGTGRAIV